MLTLECSALVLSPPLSLYSSCSFLCCRAKSIKNAVTVNIELSAEEWRRRYEKEKIRADKLKVLLEKVVHELNRWRNGTVKLHHTCMHT